jgi:hypothetical protein
MIICNGDGNASGQLQDLPDGLTRKPKLAASERKEPKADGLIRNGEWRQVFFAEMIPPLRSLRCLRSFVAIQFRSSGLTTAGGWS